VSRPSFIVHRSPFTVLPLSVLFAVSAFAADLNPPEAESLIRTALAHAYRQEFAASESVLNQLLDQFPDNPAGYFFRGALWQLRMFDAGSDSLISAFMNCMDQTVDKATRVLELEPDAWAHLYVGAAHTYRAIFYGWHNELWNCYTWGIKAPAELNKALALNSNLADACLGLGVNEYFHHAAGRYLTGLSLFGSLNRSIGLVRRAGDGDGYFSATARYFLAWMLGHEKRQAEACSLLNDLLAQYPGNRVFRKLLRDTYYTAKDYDSAIRVGAELGQELAEIMPDNLQARAENQLTLAKSEFWNGNKRAALAYCDSIVAQEQMKHQVLGLGNFVREAKALKRKM
jgi:tetratricopeptide (TPR) repeat protein